MVAAPTHPSAVPLKKASVSSLSSSNSLPSSSDGMSTEFTQATTAAGAAADGASGTAAVKPKPALVKDKHRKKKKDSKELTWDEEAIEEHDQLRGTRMKIDEPNTPYHNYDSGSETDGSHSGRREMRFKGSPTNRGHPTISWDTLQNKLDSVAAVREQYPSSPSSQGMAASNSAGEGEMDVEQNNNGTVANDDNEMDPAERRRIEMKKLEFKEHRKRHYNEMELVRKWRQQHADEEDEDADDENEA